MALVEQKREAGDTQTVLQPEEAPPESAEVIDLTALLQRSLGGKEGKGAKSGAKVASKPPAKKAQARKAPAKGTAPSGTAARKRKAA
ncbi:hypothetical protein D9M68_1002760 [compost metagenome]